MLQALTFYKARQLEKQKKWQQAFDLYNQYASSSTDVSGKLAYRLGFVAEKLKKNDVALKWLKLAVQKEPQNARWHARLAKVAVQAGKYQIAVDAYADKGTQVFSEASWHYDLGWLLEKNKNYEQAADFYRNAVQLDPTIANYSYRLGRANQLAENFEAAAKAYKEAIAKGKADADSLICLGRCLKELDDLTEAKAVYLQLLSLEAEAKYHIAAYYQLAEIELTETHYEKALAYCEQVLEQQAGHAGAWFVQSQSLMALGQGKAALDSLQKAVKLQPKNTEWQIALAIFCQHSGPFSVAANAWGQVLKSDPLNQEWILQHALALDMAAKVPEAIKIYTKLAQLQSDSDTDFEEEQNSIGCYIDALELYYAKQFKASQEHFEKALELYGEEAPAHWYYRLGQALSLGGRAAEAEAHLQRAISLSPLNQYYVYALAQAIRRQGRTWQEVEVLEQTLTVVQDPENANPNIDFIAKWSFELGEAQDKMNRFAEAAEAFAKANCLKPDNAMWYFREGYAWERAGKTRQAEQAYDLAIAADKNLKANEFGVGVFHQQRGFWPQAAEAYAQRAKNELWNAELQYRLGFAHDRCYRWEQAEQCYRQALVFKPHQPDWHYRLGFVLERQEKWLEAARFYRFAATTREKHTPYWFYRLGYVLHKAGEQEKACRAFLQTRTQVELPSLPTTNARLLPADLNEYELEAFTDDYSQQQKQSLRQLCESDAALLSRDQAQAYYALGQQAERREMWQEAAELYQQAVRRSNGHQPIMYYRLGYVLVQLDRLAEACTAFVNTRIFQQPHGVDMSRYEKNVGLIHTMEYTEFLETLPVEKNTIVYESFLGASLSCNPYAIYLHLVDNPAYEHFRHIWIVTDETKLPFDYQPRGNTILIKRQSTAYRRYLASAEYLINNVTFPFWFIRREEQKYLNTWHGTPLKGLGKDMPGEFYVHGNVSRNFLQATHLLSPNRHTSDVMMKSYDIAGIYGGLLAETGYPRIDLTLNATDEQKIALKNYLGLSNDKPMILYAPTWRGQQGTVATDIKRILSDLEGLASDDYQLVFRGHHFAEEALREADIPVLVADQSVDANLLLSITDVLITDYSSIFFDFLVTKKPIIYYAYDLEEYSQVRGLYFAIESMPGTLCHTREEVLGAIQISLSRDDIEELSTVYLNAISGYVSLECGLSTERAVDYFIKNIKEKVIDIYNDDREVLLFSNGEFLPNGITSSFLNLLNSLPNKKIKSVIAIEPEKIKNNAQKIEKFELLSKDVSVHLREGRVLMNPEQQWIEELFMRLRGLRDTNAFDQHKAIYAREYDRLYGLTNKIDVTVNFEGYSREWTLILANNPKSLIFLHNDMYKEFKFKHAHLSRNYSFFNEYKKLVSVSKVLSDVNKKNMTREFGISNDLFDYCENTINSSDIFERSEEELDEDLKQWFVGSNTFLTMGRMSPEKDHQKLIKAFGKVNKIYPDSKLVILGDGPLREKLKEQTVELDLEEKILFAGQRSNPFPALKACSCFVLPSNHEGQPMVLLEAMVLKKPILATDIDGNRGVLQKYNGNLVTNSVEGLEQGLIQFINGDLQDCVFDVKTYQKEAVDNFCSLLEIN